MYTVIKLYNKHIQFIIFRLRRPFRIVVRQESGRLRKILIEESTECNVDFNVLPQAVVIKMESSGHAQQIKKLNL